MLTAPLLVCILAACGGGGSRAGAVRITGAPGPVIQVLSRLAITDVETARLLPPRSWAVSFDLRLSPAGRIELGLGYGGKPLVLSRKSGWLVVDGHQLTIPRGWLRGSWHVEATNTALAIDGRWLPVRASAARQMTLRALAGNAEVDSLIITAAGDRALLLLHRLAELHARLPLGRFPLSADLADRIHDGTSSWTSGFWPGALWQAAQVAPQDGLFARWALQATVAHLGRERAQTHDVGFMYGQSSLAAWRALCSGGAPPLLLCGRLRQSVVAAANELVALAASNALAGTIPTNPFGPQADTIIDSMLNVLILPWAARFTGDPAFLRLAARHARLVASLLVRADGSTAQSVHFDRATGRFLFIHTHQGLSNASTWSRGESWALYGFAQAAADLHDRSLLRVALRLARYVQNHLPAGGVPPWDYDAPPGAPVDVSAGAIGAAGLLHLVAACRSLPGVCGATGPWASLARKMLAGVLGHASAEPPLGFLSGQVLDERGRGCWCDGGELIFGLSYALEADRPVSPGGA